MGYQFDTRGFVNQAPGRGVAYYERMNPDAVLADDQAFQGANKALGYGSLIGLAGLPVVQNNMQYAEPYINYMQGLNNVAEGINQYGDFRTAMQLLNPGVGGSASFAQSVSPGNLASGALETGATSLNPYVGVGMLANNLTANEANPYGAIPGLKQFNQGLDYVTSSLNSTPLARSISKGAQFAYNNSLGLITDTAPFRGLYGLAEIPMQGVQGASNFLREGYQALDRNVFGNILPGGAQDGDEESMTWNDPFEGIKRALTEAPDKFRTKRQLTYDGLNPVAQKLVDRFEEKGFDFRDAVDLATKYRDSDGDEHYVNYDTILKQTKPEDLGFTQEEFERASKSMQYAMNDPYQNPYLDLSAHMKEKHGVDIDFGEDFYINAGLGEMEDRAEQLNLDAQNFLTSGDYGAVEARDILGPNALTDEVLNIINSDLDPDMSVAEAKSWSEMNDVETKFGMLDLTEKEKYDIALSNDFNSQEYTEHLQYLEDFDNELNTSQLNELLSLDGADLSKEKQEQISSSIELQTKYDPEGAIESSRIYTEKFGDIKAKEFGYNSLQEMSDEADKIMEVDVKKMSDKQFETLTNYASIIKDHGISLNATSGVSLTGASEAISGYQSHQVDLANKAEALKKEQIRLNAIQSRQHTARVERDLATQRITLNHIKDVTRYHTPTIQVSPVKIRSNSGNIKICWVAREVYGAENPRWLEFREWIINEAPSHIYNAYLEHGPGLAEYISDKPELKSKIRNFMDSKIV